MFNKLRNYFFTIRYLKPIQIKYRIFYFIRNRFRRIVGFRYPLFLAENELKTAALPAFSESIFFEKSWIGEHRFSFLNIEHDFEKTIDWNFKKHGLLWTYNLNYFDFLNQENVKKTEGLAIIGSFLANTDDKSVGFEPFPISLRLINWVKFFIKNGINEPCFRAEIRRAATILTDKLEFHILGNHLLENGFGLLFAAFFLKNENFLKIAEKILATELDEQIRPDGGHFENSPMYHQIMLFRVLDCLNLVKSNPHFGQNLRPIFEEKAAKMCGWLEHFTFKNGQIPMVNDAAPNIAPTTENLLFYAKKWQIEPIFKQKTFELGYRMFRFGSYECLIDAAEIAPDYQPGHAHSDSLNFLLTIKNQPILVDSGISTYEKNDVRQSERSTRAHNTLMVENREQTEVWDGFRVARRAKTGIWEEKNNELGAALFCYESLGVLISRSWKFSENQILLKELADNPKNRPIESFYHFHPEITPKLVGNRLEHPLFSVEFDAKISLHLEKYDFAEGFNRTREAIVLVTKFTQSNEILFKINQ
jgi:hypothetical protein